MANQREAMTMVDCIRFAQLAKLKNCLFSVDYQSPPHYLQQKEKN